MGEKRKSAKSDTVKVEADAAKKIKLSLFAAAVSATLRMVVPTIGLFMVGLTVDLILRQTAFFAIIGAIVGFVVAAGLIYLQLKRLKAGTKDLLINDPQGALETKTANKTAKEKR